MLQPGSSRGFNPLDQCGPFLVSPAIPLGQTAVDAENMGSNRLCAWERECFASHHPYSRVDRECSCWGPFPPAIGVSDSNPRMTFFPPNVPEISSSQAGYNRSVPPAHMLSLMWCSLVRSWDTRLPDDKKRSNVIQTVPMTLFRSSLPVTACLLLMSGERHEPNNLFEPVPDKVTMKSLYKPETVHCQ